MTNEVTVHLSIYDRLVENSRLWEEHKANAIGVKYDRFGGLHIIKPDEVAELVDAKLLKSVEFMSKRLEELTAEKVKSSKLEVKLVRHWWRCMIKGK